jgi:hypothetical protein
MPRTEPVPALNSPMDGIKVERSPEERRVTITGRSTTIDNFPLPLADPSCASSRLPMGQVSGILTIDAEPTGVQ